MLLLTSLIYTLPLYLSNESSSTIFLQPTDKEKIANIISSFNSNKASWPNSIPYRIFVLLKTEISKQLADLFNLSFKTGVSPSVLKTGKLIPIFKKDSKIDYSNYRPILLLSNTEKKYLKNLCIGDYIPSLIIKIYLWLTVWIQTTILYISRLN